MDINSPACPAGHGQQARTKCLMDSLTSYAPILQDCCDTCSQNNTSTTMNHKKCFECLLTLMDHPGPPRTCFRLPLNCPSHRLSFQCSQDTKLQPHPPVQAPSLRGDLPTSGPLAPSQGLQHRLRGHCLAPPRACFPPSTLEDLDLMAFKMP